MISPGEIYWADLDTGRHKVVVVSRDELNRGDKVLVALITSKRFGMTADCVIQCEDLFPAFVADLDSVPNGVLDEAVLREVVRAVGFVMDADCEPV